MTRRSVAILSLACMGLLGAAPQRARVTGTLTAGERVSLSPASVVEITLEDVSRADAPGPVVSRVRIERPEQLPFAFEVPYEPALIEPSHRYAVSARIVEGTEQRFATTIGTPALTQGHGPEVVVALTRTSPREATVISAPSVTRLASRRRGTPPALGRLPATFVGVLPCADCPGIRYQLNLFPDDSFLLRMTYLDRPVTRDDIGSWGLSSDSRVLVLKGASQTPEFFTLRDALTLRKLDGNAAVIASRVPYDLRRAPAVQPLAVRLPMRGSYRITVGAGEFTECSTGQRWTVADTGARASLDVAYRSSSSQAGHALFVSLEGQLTLTTPQRLAIDRVVSTDTSAACTPRFASAPLASTYWRLARLGTSAIVSPADRRNEAALTFRDESQSFGGSDGCNRVAGDYITDRDAIVFKSVGSLKACTSEANLGFGAALSGARRFRIVGKTLELFDAQDRSLARFDARD